MKKLFETMFAFLVCGAITITTIVIIAGAFKWALSFINDTQPQTLEWIGVFSIAFIGGAIGAVLYLTKDD